MSFEDADQLQNILVKAEAWPIWSADYTGGISVGAAPQMGMYGRSAKDLELWVGLRESDRERVAKLVDWPADRNYYVDPLAERISQAFSDLLFGEDPQWKAATESDQEKLDHIIEENDLPSELRRACSDSSSEGETWWRIYTDPEQSDAPIAEFHSRLDVIPLFRGRKLIAAAFISVLFTQEMMVEKVKTTIYWRHIEVQTEGYVRNLLFKGSMGSLGSLVPLTEQEQTEDYPEEWDHGLEVMLAGRVPNKLGRDYRLGVSDYQGIRDLLLAINEVTSISAENARLTAKQKMVVPASAVQDDGRVDLGSDVLIAESLDRELENPGKSGPYAVLEYTFQAAPLIEYKDSLVSTALTRVGLAEQFTGGGRASSGGNAGLSGTALRTRLIPTTLAAAGKGRFWDDALPKISRCLQLVDNLPQAQGGCGTNWSDANTAPVITRATVLPEDSMEEVTRHVTAVAGEIESVEAAVQDLHPDWDEGQVNDELERIYRDRTLFGTGPKTGAAAGEAGEPPAAEGGANGAPFESST